MVGTTISHYKAIRKLGGGMGVVYEAEDLSLLKEYPLPADRPAELPKAKLSVGSLDPPLNPPYVHPRARREGAAETDCQANQIGRRQAHRVRRVVDQRRVRNQHRAQTAMAYLSAATNFEVTQVVDRTKGVHALIKKSEFGAGGKISVRR